MKLYKIFAPRVNQEQRLKSLLSCEFKDNDIEVISFVGRVGELFYFSKC